MPCTWDPVTLGRTGLRVCPLGLASSYGVSGADVERAVERGVNYLYWGSLRKADFGRAVARIARRRREEVVVVVQTYTRIAALMRPSLERALRQLGLDHADLLLLGWWNRPPSPRVRDAALALQAAGRARHIMVSGHHRPTFPTLARDPALGAIMVRHNAAHPGAEEEIFPHLAEPRPGVVAYTATRWGTLLDPRLTPPGEATPRGSDCYRFVLGNPSVDVVLAGPKDGQELDEALAALDRGPLGPDEQAWMRRVGRAVRAARMAGQARSPVQALGRLVRILRR